MQYLYDSPIGPLTIISSGQHITHIKFSAPVEPGQKDPLIQQVCGYLDAYFAGLRPDSTSIPLKPAGTVFQTRIWAYLQQIPYGKTVTYGDLAKRYACDFGVPKMSAQAVGQAVRANPIPLLIPCHRVLGAGGKLTGFTGGLDKKVLLLKTEKAL